MSYPEAIATEKTCRFLSGCRSKVFSFLCLNKTVISSAENGNIWENWGRTITQKHRENKTQVPKASSNTDKCLKNRAIYFTVLFWNTDRIWCRYYIIWEKKFSMWEKTFQESIFLLNMQLNELSVCAEEQRCSHKPQAQQGISLNQMERKVRYIVRNRLCICSVSEQCNCYLIKHALPITGENST